jgi:hypothetical protein
MPEAELHAKTTFRTQKRGFLSATPFIQQFDFLKEEVIWE